MTPEQEAILRKLLTGSDERLPMGPYKESSSVSTVKTEWHLRMKRHGLILKTCKISRFYYADIVNENMESLLLRVPPVVFHLNDLCKDFEKTVTADFAQDLCSLDVRKVRSRRLSLTRLVLRYSR